MLQKVIGPPQSMRWLDPILSAINLNSKVLDVGCGSGELIRLLRRIGFSNLTGIDPLISKESYNSKGLRILKRYLHMLDEQFDLVMLHHSFEHMPDPHSVFSQLYRVMSPGANLLIRTPVVPSYAWNQYGVDWVQLDAPRHLFIYSVKSMMWLSEKVGLSLLNVQFDSTGFQLWGSEQYRMDIHLLDKRSHLCSTMATIFSKQAMRAFDLKAEELNGQNMGDQACFYFQKPSLH
jgi:ubiquinone/menaquinone biosynthesis C-methylase UbiE